MKHIVSAGMILLATCAAATDLLSKELIGQATVVDGDTIEIHGQPIRLFGIDAAESDQLCKDANGKDYRCGQRAALLLDEFADGKTVTCVQIDTDQWGRPVSKCVAVRQDLGAYMVDQGHALAFTRYSRMYVENEAEAKRKGVGLWSGTFENPWDYRARKRAEQKQNAATPPVKPPEGCVIKGNVNKKGERIYHVPGSRSYADTKINKADERWFCTVEEAEAAGWRAP